MIVSSNKFITRKSKEQKKQLSNNNNKHVFSWVLCLFIQLFVTYEYNQDLRQCLIQNVHCIQYYTNFMSLHLRFPWRMEQSVTIIV